MPQLLSIIEYAIIGFLAILFLVIIGLFFLKMIELRRWHMHFDLWFKRSRERWESDDSALWWASPKGTPAQASLGALLVQSAWEHRALVPEALEKVLTTELSSHKRKIESSVAWIGTIGANAPFVGLTGTVLGILGAFQAMATQHTGGSTELMAAISRSLVATAAGLAVAIPAVILYNLLRQRIHVLHENGQDLIRLLLARSLQAGAEAWQRAEQERHEWHREQWQLHHNEHLER